MNFIFNRRDVEFVCLFWQVYINFKLPNYCTTYNYVTFNSRHYHFKQGNKLNQDFTVLQNRDERRLF